MFPRSIVIRIYQVLEGWSHEKKQRSESYMRVELSHVRSSHS